MNILVICGNTKKGGMTEGILRRFEERLSGRGVNLERVNLRDLKFNDCIGCQSCIRTGNCNFDDDLTVLKKKIVAASGLILASPVRDDYPTALFKKFYERLSYSFKFTTKLKNKPVVAVSTTGVRGGEGATRKILGLKLFRVMPVGYIYEKVGFNKRFKDSKQLERRVSGLAEKLVLSARKFENGECKNNLTFKDRIFKIFVRLNQRHMEFIYKEWYGGENEKD